MFHTSLFSLNLGITGRRPLHKRTAFNVPCSYLSISTRNPIYVFDKPVPLPVFTIIHFLSGMLVFAKVFSSS